MIIFSFFRGELFTDIKLKQNIIYIYIYFYTFFFGEAFGFLTMDFDKAYDTINSIKKKLNSEKKFTESVDPSIFNTVRKELVNENTKSPLVKPTTLSQLINNVDFIPYFQERDGLGKLIVNVKK